MLQGPIKNKTQLQSTTVLSRTTMKSITQVSFNLVKKHSN
jgi:hypothetical protein